jgi:hypothetical protein
MVQDDYARFGELAKRLGESVDEGAGGVCAEFAEVDPLA